MSDFELIASPSAEGGRAISLPRMRRGSLARTVAYAIVVVSLVSVVLCLAFSTKDGQLSRHFFNQGEAQPLDSLPILRNVIPPCAAELPRARGFAMLMTGHSATTAIMSRLYGHPDVMTSVMEPLHVSRPRRSIRAIAREYWGAARARNQISGFKVDVFGAIHQEEEDWKEVIKNYSVRLLYVFRHNHFKRAVGMYPQDFFDDNTATGGAGINQDIGTVRFNITNFKGLHCLMIKSIGLQSAQATVIGKIAPCHLKVSYEEYLAYPDHVEAQIEDYLGLKRDLAPSKRKKVTPDNMCETITNFEEICAYFGDCMTWRNYIEDPENSCSCKPYKYKSKGPEGENPYCEWENVNYC